jgi:hypothetical protein
MALRIVSSLRMEATRAADDADSVSMLCTQHSSQGWRSAGALARPILEASHAPKRPLTTEERDAGHNSSRTVRAGLLVITSSRRRNDLQARPRGRPALVRPRLSTKEAVPAEQDQVASHAEISQNLIELEGALGGTAGAAKGGEAFRTGRGCRGACGGSAGTAVSAAGWGISSGPSAGIGRRPEANFGGSSGAGGGDCAVIGVVAGSSGC